MRRVIESHNITYYHNITRVFNCSRCEVLFESDEYTAEEHDGIILHFDYCPICGVGNFVKEAPDAKQNTT